MILEVRPGEGGDDAVHFANQLFTALLSYAKKQRLTVVTQDATGRTLQANVEGSPGPLEPFAGVHRIQRCPASDSRGRRHTSTATVAVLDRPAAIKIDINDADIIVQTYRGTGPGGQHRNKTDSAVRMIHVPTGVVVCSEEERSQWLNRQKARARLFEQLAETQRLASAQALGVERNQQIASGERPTKEYTWNAQRGEVVDHSNGRRWQLKAALRGQF